jgi:hypothetical protein
MLMEISVIRASFYQTPQRVPATMRMTPGQAANLAARLNLLRYHQVMRAQITTVMSLTDLDESNARPESQNWQVEHGLIPAPGAKARVRALNAKKKENTKTSQLDPEFELVE